MFSVVHLIWVVLPTITALKCGTPGVPANSYIKPLQESYDDGDVVWIFCKHKFHLVADESYEHQTCVAGVWNGTQPTCLENLAFGSDFYFASLEADEGVSITSAGEYRRQLWNATEHVYLSVAWERKRLTTEAIVYFQGNFSAQTRSGSNLPLAREVVHYHDYYGVCHQRFRRDMYFCSVPEPFGSAKVQVRLLSKPLSNLNENPVEIILNVPDNGILVLDHANMSCGMPPAPWQGSVVVNVSTATYQCYSGYELKGDAIKTCDTTGNPAHLWPPGNPLCVESPAGLSWGIVAAVLSAGFLVFVCLVLGVCCLYLQMKKREKPASTGVTMTELKAMDLNNQLFEGFSPNCPSSVSSGYTAAAVQYPLIVSDLYSPESDYLAVSYDDVENENVYETLE